MSWVPAKYNFHVNERYMILKAYKISLRILVKTGKINTWPLWERGNICSYIAQGRAGQPSQRVIKAFFHKKTKKNSPRFYFYVFITPFSRPSQIALKGLSLPVIGH